MSEKYRLNPSNGFFAEKEGGCEYSDIVFTAVIIDPATTEEDLCDRISQIVEDEQGKWQIIVITNVELSNTRAETKKKNKILVMTIEGLQQFLDERASREAKRGQNKLNKIRCYLLKQREIAAIVVLAVIMVLLVLMGIKESSENITIILNKGVLQMLDSETKYIKQSEQPQLVQDQNRNLSETEEQRFADKKRKPDNAAVSIPSTEPTETNAFSSIETANPANIDVSDRKETTEEQTDICI